MSALRTLRFIPELVERLVTFIWNLTSFCLLWLVAVIVTWREFRSVESRRKPWGHYSGELTCYDEILPSTAEQYLNGVTESSLSTDAKVRFLVVLSGAALGLTTVVEGRSGLTLWQPALVVAAAAFTATLLLAVRNFDCRREQVPAPQVDQAEWTIQVLKTAAYNRTSHAMRVDLFVAARRWLIIGIVSLAVSSWVPVVAPRSATRVGDAETGSANAADELASPLTATEQVVAPRGSSTPSADVTDSTRGN